MAAAEAVPVYGGVDTHGEFHVAAAVDQLGRQLGAATFGADTDGYDRLWVWMRSFGVLETVGVEGTGSYGAGLSRYLVAKGERVVEVDRPDRQLRYRKGKSDATDAVAAAHAAASGRAKTTPKTGTGGAECLRALDVARRSAVKARTQASNQIRDLIRTAPAALREHLQTYTPRTRIRVCARLRPTGIHDPTNATKTALRTLARRYQALTEEINQLDQALTQLCADLNPALLGAQGVGPQTATALLIAAGDNPHRLRNQAAFAALCGTNPIPASSGNTQKHRLNRGGNRQANRALHTIAINRLQRDPRTKTYATRRQTEGKTKRETLRCLKRYIAREIYQLITNPPQTPTGPQLRTARTTAGITLQTAAQHLNTHPIRLSQLERRLTHDTQLATRYHQWITTHHPN